MDSWPNYPTVYEINAWVWLSELSRAHGRPVTLGDVPQAELERLAGYAFDALWLMGVWERSGGARRISRTHPELLEEYRHTLPDYTEADVVGSPTPSGATGWRRHSVGTRGWRGCASGCASWVCGCCSTSSRTTWR